MNGINCLIFNIFVKFCVSHVILPDILQSAIQNMRSKREEPCGEDIDLEASDGAAEIELRTELFNCTEFYRTLEDCTWTLKTAQDKIMVLKSDYFSVEESTDCVLDYLMITEEDINGTSSRFCGWDPLTYITFSHKITLQFKSDNSFEDEGFKLIIESIKKCGDDNIGNIVDGEESRIMNNEALGEDCLYRIQAPEDKVITLDLKMLNFGSASCEEERITIYEGHSKQGEPLDTICSDKVIDILPYHANSMIIEYRNTLKQEGERFTIYYNFVEDTFTRPTEKPTTPSPVGGNNDCSGMYKGIHTNDAMMIYEAPEYEDNKECTVVVRNEELPLHVVQIEFDYFDIEYSTNCTFDSLKIMSGERKDSDLLGGPYCGESLNGRTFLTRGNSLRLEFKTDDSFALKGFKAKISFVPNKDCTCKGDKKCIRQDYEKKCVQGQDCVTNICQNGGTCIRNGSKQTCYCPKGFNGKHCSRSDGELLYHISFTKAPISRTLERGESHTEECEVKRPPGKDIKYEWSFQGRLIAPYSEKDGFGYHPGGVLQIDKFSDALEGQYSCSATISNLRANTISTSRAEHNFEYRIKETCDFEINPGPQDDIKKIGDLILLQCKVDFRAEVRWKKNGVYLEHDKDSTRVMKLTNNYLKISSIELSDEGDYECEAKDKNGCVSYRKGTLQVLNLKSVKKYCGLSVHDVDKQTFSKIIQGSEALPNMHPWHVTLRSRGKAERHMPFCGGTLISRRFVVTAAHCIDEFKSSFEPENVELLLGTTVCKGNPTDGITKTFQNVYIHPNYKDTATHSNDIAILELDSPVEYSDSVRPICVEPANYNDRVFLENSSFAGRVMGKVAGCGTTAGSSDIKFPNTLQVVHIPYVYTEECLDSFHGDDKKLLTDTMFCAGSNIARTGDTCKGDSGGGLVMTTSVKWVLTGIVSWAQECDGGENYGVYTNVGMFYDWIDNITKFSEEEVPDFINAY